jgi:hypothetical protein
MSIAKTQDRFSDILGTGMKKVKSPRKVRVQPYGCFGRKFSKHGLEAHATHGQDGRATKEFCMAKHIPRETRG